MEQLSNRRVRDLLRRDRDRTIETLDLLLQKDRQEFPLKYEETLATKTSTKELQSMLPAVVELMEARFGIAWPTLPRIHRSVLPATTLTVCGGELLKGTAIMSYFINVCQPLVGLPSSNAVLYLATASLFAEFTLFPQTHYNSLSGAITIGCCYGHPVDGSVAHEAVHHLQHAYGSSTLPWKRAFLEGHARGMARGYIDQRFLETDDHMYRSFTKVTVDEREAVRNWLDGKRRVPGAHALGNALFSIKEYAEGPGIYKDVLLGKPVFS